MDRLTSVVSVLSEKRYWWERVWNTAQTDGEDSVCDPNGCRVSMSALGVTKGLSPLLGKGWVPPNRLGIWIEKQHR
jgi:hypothetical protein